MQQRYIAMWSGPRNISTALMRSWGNRTDTVVIDEPFYAHYLQQTGYQHPGAAEIVQHYDTDWRTVAEMLTGEIPDNKSIYYQKHMTQHILDHMDKSWMQKVSNCFLVRDPRRMILSFAKIIPNPKVDQMGLQQQVDLFHYVCDTTGLIPPVISAKDVLQNPRQTLSRLCQVLDIPFDEAMLQWEAGRRDTDGIWSDYWYDSVEKSTNFMPYWEDDTTVPQYLQPLLDECEHLYEQMAPYCIR